MDAKNVSESLAPCDFRPSRLFRDAGILLPAHVEAVAPSRFRSRRGLSSNRKPLAVLTEMRGRGRYAIAFRVDEYWKGPRQPTVIVYGLDNGSDCLRRFGLRGRKRLFDFRV